MATDGSGGAVPSPSGDRVPHLSGLSGRVSSRDLSVAQTGSVNRDITTLPRTVDAPEGKPVRPEAADNQRLMAEILADSSSWTAELAEFTAQVFDAMAETWVDERGGYRAAPLIDALDRGGAFRVGRCLEIGSGTGCLDSLPQRSLERRRLRGPLNADDLAPVDGLSGPGRCKRAPVRRCVFRRDRHRRWTTLREGDGQGPLPERNADLVERARGGSPYYQPTADMWDALVDVSPESKWSAVESEALWGSWVVFRRSKMEAT